jgi:hypothetical protein
MRNDGMLGLVVLSVVLVVGCNPVTTGIEMGVKVAGKVVDDAETQKLGQQLVGQPPSAADQLLGPRENVLRQVNGRGLWLVYPVKMDVLGMSRYVVAVANNRIVSVQMIGKDTGDVDMARNVYYYEKVKGKSPADAQASLGLGSPVLVVRSQTTGQRSELYDASMVEGLGGKVYCILRYDNGLCTKAEMYKENASTQQQ